MSKSNQNTVKNFQKLTKMTKKPNIYQIYRKKKSKLSNNREKFRKNAEKRPKMSEIRSK